MPSNSAEYMRSYRARKKFVSTGPRPITGMIRPTEGEPIEFSGSASEVITQLSNEIMALREEVARLKRELATRPLTLTVQRSVPVLRQPDEQRNPFAEFHPAPKPK